MLTDLIHEHRSHELLFPYQVLRSLLHNRNITKNTSLFNNSLFLIQHLKQKQLLALVRNSLAAVSVLARNEAFHSSLLQCLKWPTGTYFCLCHQWLHLGTEFRLYDAFVSFDHPLL